MNAPKKKYLFTFGKSNYFVYLSHSFHKREKHYKLYTLHLIHSKWLVEMDNPNFEDGTKGFCSQEKNSSSKNAQHYWDAISGRDKTM